MSIILTSLTRKDGLALCVEHDRAFEFRPDSVKPVTQAILKQHSPPEKQSIDNPPHTIHVLVGNDVMYLTVTTKGFPALVAFTYLEELSQEFASQHGAQVNTADRPFTFMRFDATIRKTRKHFADAAKSEDPDLHKMKVRRESADRFPVPLAKPVVLPNPLPPVSPLQDAVSSLKDLVRANIDDVLKRGENLSALSDAGAALSAQSRTYQRDAERMERYARLQKYAPIIVLGILLALLAWYVLYRIVSGFR